MKNIRIQSKDKNSNMILILRTTTTTVNDDIENLLEKCLDSLLWSNETVKIE